MTFYSFHCWCLHFLSFQIPDIKPIFPRHLFKRVKKTNTKFAEEEVLHVFPGVVSGWIFTWLVIYVTYLKLHFRFIHCHTYSRVTFSFVSFVWEECHHQPIKSSNQVLHHIFFYNFIKWLWGRQQITSIIFCGSILWSLWTFLWLSALERKTIVDFYFKFIMLSFLSYINHENVHPSFDGKILRC